MLALEVVCITRETIAALVARNESTDGAIVAMSKTFGLEMGAQLCKDAGTEGAEPDEIAGIKVAYKDDVEEPALITATGKVYPLLPDWARAGKATNTELKRILQPVH